MIRSFLALPVLGKAASLLRGIQRPIAGARRVPQDDLHLTLAFLGDQSEAVLRGLVDDLARLTAVSRPVPVKLLGPDVIGGRSPRAVTLAAEHSDPLMTLQNRVMRVLRDNGLSLERRRFKPHVTLYRMPNTLPVETPQAIQSWLDGQIGAAEITFTATEVRLFESRLTPDGPIYSSLAEFPLGPETDQAPA